MNLIICCTALQSVISSRVIIEERVEKFDVIFSHWGKTPQLEYYKGKLSNNSNNSFCFAPDEKFKLIYWILKNNFEYNTVYVANIHDIKIQLLLSKLKYRKLVTFDDGTSNIDYKSPLYIDRYNKTKRNVLRLLGCNLDLCSVKKLISYHYTIFKDVPNISENTKYISLCDFTVNKLKANSRNVANVLLGTVFDEITSPNNKKKLTYLINLHFKEIDFYYIPHPRDLQNHFPKGITITGVEMAEIKIINMLSNYKSINLFGFNSTVQFNLSGVDGVRNFNIKSPHISNPINIESDFEDLFLL